MKQQEQENADPTKISRVGVPTQDVPTWVWGTPELTWYWLTMASPIEEQKIELTAHEFVILKRILADMRGFGSIAVDFESADELEPGEPGKKAGAKPAARVGETKR